MKHIKKIMKYPFLSILILSIILFSLLGYIRKNTIYANYSVEHLKTPQLAVVFEGLQDGIYPWTHKTHNSYLEDKAAIEVVTNVTKNENISNNTNEKDANKEDTNVDDANIDDANADKTTTDNTKTDHASVTKNQKHQTDTDSISNENKKNTKDKNIDKKEELSSKTFPFKKVTKDYFNDALFIGDSRTVGLSEYSGWSNVTFYADVGLTIYDIFDKKIAEVDGNKITIKKALKQKKFKKIYIMLGINELGRGTTDLFIAEYKKVIAIIQKLQPDAIIIVEGIMNVSKEKSDTDPIFNNVNIKDKNDHLALLADNKTIFYIDVNEAITNKSGYLPSKYTFDNIHLKAAYYEIWTDFLLKHGIDTN